MPLERFLVVPEELLCAAVTFKVILRGILNRRRQYRVSLGKELKDLQHQVDNDDVKKEIKAMSSTHLTEVTQVSLIK